MAFISVVGAAMSGTLGDFKEFHEPGTANVPTRSGESILMIAVTNEDPVNRAAISNFLIDDGADVTWIDSGGRYSLPQVLVSGMYPKEPIAVSDCELLARLMDEGADVNAVAKKGGTLVQDLVEKTMNLRSEQHMVPVYDVVFARDDLDLVKTGAFGRSSYRDVWLSRDDCPVLWGYVERFVADHGVVVPDEERRPQ